MKEIRRHCCTTLSAVEAHTREMLAKSNSELAANVATSPAFPRANPLRPILSPLSNAAHLLPCRPVDLHEAVADEEDLAATSEEPDNDDEDNDGDDDDDDDGDGDDDNNDDDGDR